MKRINYYIVFLFLISYHWSFGQSIQLVNGVDQTQLPGVRIDINVQNKIIHARTNNNGIWIIPDSLYHKNLTLKFSFLGYTSVRLNHKRILNDTTIALYSDIKQYNEVVVTAQYKSQKLNNAVHNIKIIDQTQLKSMAAQNLKDALSNELNVYLSEDNILGTSIQMQGIGGENVKILIDGVPLTGRLNGNIDLSQIPINQVERIEVVEGPLSVVYGTDALAGTINIITKKSQHNQFEASSNNYFESAGKVNNDIRLGWHRNNHQWNVNGGRQFFDGWNPNHSTFEFDAPKADTNRALLWKPKIQWFAGANYQFRGAKSTLNYGGQYLHETIIDRGTPRAPLNISAFDSYFRTQRINQRLNYRYQINEKNSIALIGGYNSYFRRKNTMVRDLTTIEDVPSLNPDANDTSQYHSFIARGRFIHAPFESKINFEVGFDLLYEIANGNNISEGGQVMEDYALFATMEYTPFSKLTIRPGLRYGYNSNYNTPLTPSINLKYDIWKNNQHQIVVRTSYARGFRSPSIKELYYEFVDANHNIVGNQNLKAEYSNNYNLSFHHQWNHNKIQLRNKLAFFYNDIHNQITLARSSATEYSYFNLNRYLTRGLQLETQASFYNWSIGLGWSYTGRYSEINSDKSFEIDDYLYSSQVNFNLQYFWAKPSINFAVYYKYTGVLPQVISDENGNYSLAVAQDYHLADFRMSKSFLNKRLELSCGVKNILGVTTIEGSQGDVISAHSSGSGMLSVGMGRTYFVGVLFNLFTKQ